ncbi:ABC-three component system middle component 1 [Pseudomonas nitroreducens]|uniref:ABC-three component system middle component 1 n=1 Tax=Pseudomonas nitroreducens TaxID=46680 RepID=UPI0020A0A009|nr:ABC-three component system middle component 1 [Pseudomonas nitroreducens]MCP1623625.1 hypothetical protein [Pseudomonas nitroreducens]
MKTFERAEASPQLSEAFREFSWSLYKAKIGESFISSFIFLIDSEENLEQNWRYISTRIAALYQSALMDDYSAWNIYLIFRCESKLSRALQYEIENDKFSMRKIVYSEAPRLLQSNVVELLNSEILGASLESQLLRNLPDISDRERSGLQELFDEFGAVPTDNKIESKNKREELLSFLLERIK